MPRDTRSDSLRALPAALPEPAGLNGTERDSAELGRAKALERVAVRRQHSGFRSPLPYFHNGFAKDLDAVIDFYDDRFGLKLTKQEHSDLVAFLRSL
jgi:cytochrome c peroxidase